MCPAVPSRHSWHSIPDELVVRGVSYGPDEMPPRVNRVGVGWGDDEMLDRLLRWRAIYGFWPSKADLNITKLRQRVLAATSALASARLAVARYRQYDVPSETAFRSHFGSLNAAIVMLGGAPRPTGRPPRSGANQPRMPRTRVGKQAIDFHIWRYQMALENDPHSQACQEAHYALAQALIATADRMFVHRPKPEE